ncbi:MAG: capsular biosynthesis protein [Pseudomonadota bacterium]
MIEEEKALVVDVDGTLCPIKRPGERYADMPPEPRMLAKLRALHAEGWRIILHSARGMRSNEGNVGRIGKHVAPDMLRWLAEHDVPFDELHLAKPWPGRQGFYIDDRAVRPREFVELDFDALNALVERDRLAKTAETGRKREDDRP